MYSRRGDKLNWEYEKGKRSNEYLAHVKNLLIYIRCGFIAIASAWLFARDQIYRTRQVGEVYY